LDFQYFKFKPNLIEVNNITASCAITVTKNLYSDNIRSLPLQH